MVAGVGGETVVWNRRLKQQQYESDECIRLPGGWALPIVDDREPTGRATKSAALCRAQPRQNCRAYRFVPAGTAWYRLVPDKIFCRYWRTAIKPAPIESQNMDHEDDIRAERRRCRDNLPRFTNPSHFSPFLSTASRCFNFMTLNLNKLRVISKNALQIVDFSPVTGIFHIFHPISHT
jgi:hypothetical protein